MRKVLFAIAALIAGYFLYPRTQTPTQNLEFTQRIERKIADIKKQNRVEIQKHDTAKADQNLAPAIAKMSQEQLDEIKMQQIVDSFNKHETGVMTAWRKYRVDLYNQIGIAGEDLKDLDQILERHMALLEEFQKEANRLELNTSNNQAVIELYNKAIKEMDEDVRLFLGDTRFKYVQSARTTFNRAYSARYHVSIETFAW